MTSSEVSTHIFTLSGGHAQYGGVILRQDDTGNPRKHLPEVLLDLLDVLAVADDVEQIFVSHEVEPGEIRCKVRLTT